MSEHATRVRKRAAAVVPALALVAAGLTTAGSSGTASAAPQSTSPEMSSSDYYINYVEPRAEEAFGSDIKVSKGETKQAEKSALEKAEEVDQKHAQGNPVAARGLAKLEAKAIKTGKDPKDLKSNHKKSSDKSLKKHWPKKWDKPSKKKHKDRFAKRYKTAESTQEARLLTILVEFDENANDDFSNVQVPTEFGATDCKPGSVQNGPTNNTIPNPANASHPDNNSMWVPNFSSEHYNKLLYTDEGITERVRTDLTGPDGKPGFDISGYTMKNMYEEMSHGAYTVDGEATPWVTVPHSEAYYGASVCHLNDEGVYEAGAIQDMQGHPENPLGPGQLPIDAVAALAQQVPDFPWSDYDIEDQGDRDGDGNYNEPDGVIDHVVLVHAGADKSGGGGAEGTYAIWAHSSAVAGGADVPGTDLKLSNYIVQPEDSGVGVFAHEYGHDLGLPDLYDTASGGDSDVDFWDLMSSGSHSGPIFQSMPTQMGLWDKWVLGWADPVEVNPGDGKASIKVGQSSRPLKGTADGIKVNLPDKVITRAVPHSGENMWYSSGDQSWADVTLTRSVDVPDAADARFWMWNNYSIESDWDFGFVEVSTDGGTTWSENKVYDENDALVSTDDGYPDPNGRMADYGGKKYGLTGSTNGWRHDYIDVSSYAGQTVDVRLRYATDAGFEDIGWFADDLSVTGDGTTTWSDDAETNNGWTPHVGTFVDTTGQGWHLDTGTSVQAQYYLVEWRNFDGFDEGLKYAYDTTYSTEDAWKVERIAYNAPGALVWYRDTSYGNANHVLNNLTNLPSGGAKGGLLIVDSHFDPLRRTGQAAVVDTSELDNMPSRPQSSNAAFGLRRTHPFTECITGADVADEYCTDVPAQPGVKAFTDDKGWVPGLEYRPDTGYWWRDPDASVVVPSVDVQPYTTPIVDADGNPLTDQYGLDFGFTITGTGNPADDGVAYGTQVQVRKSYWDNRAAQIRVSPPSVG